MAGRALRRFVDDTGTARTAQHTDNTVRTAAGQDPQTPPQPQHVGLSVHEADFVYNPIRFTLLLPLDINLDGGVDWL
jgi:hypothetical protein